jgi:hypothetical protein
MVTFSKRKAEVKKETEGGGTATLISFASRDWVFWWSSILHLATTKNEVKTKESKR